ncbi:hypothetical protein R3P38DRAFT_3173633 [Favolaschia claudopus]|uniref:Uncharacterized protein n=1 Tax=Favolaschia claudopus TaxID=2862362 RepID=A0AAW0DGC9_9AGAR
MYGLGNSSHSPADSTYLSPHLHFTNALASTPQSRRFLGRRKHRRHVASSLPTSQSTLTPQPRRLSLPLASQPPPPLTDASAATTNSPRLPPPTLPTAPPRSRLHHIAHSPRRRRRRIGTYTAQPFPIDPYPRRRRRHSAARTSTPFRSARRLPALSPPSSTQFKQPTPLDDASAANTNTKTLVDTTLGIAVSPTRALIQI